MEHGIIEVDLKKASVGPEAIRLIDGVSGVERIDEGLFRVNVAGDIAAIREEVIKLGGKSVWLC